MKNFLYVLLPIFFFSQSLIARNGYLTSLVGIIQEANNQAPIEYATIGLYSSDDSTLVTGTISETGGRFKLEKINPGFYYLTLSFIGFKSKTIVDVLVSAKSKPIDLGIITLYPDVLALEEVVVTSTRTAISMNIDKQIINVASNISAQGGTAVDALKTAPAINVDHDGNVNLRGSENFTVLINGKPTSLKSSEVLKQTPANIIDKIEVITNPSVKYQAEGGAGIINIILKKDSTSGLNGLANLSVGSKSKYGADLNLNLNSKKFNLTASLAWDDKVKTAINNYYRELEKSDTVHHAFLGQDRMSNDNNLGFRFNVDYNLSNKSRLGYSLNSGYTKNKMDIVANTSGYTIPAKYEQYGLNTYKFIQKPTFFTNNLSYTLNLKENHALSLVAYYSYIDYYLLTSHNQAVADKVYLSIDPQPYRQEILNDNYSHDTRFDLDYSHPINNHTQLETGISFHKYTRFLNITYDQFNYEMNTWISNPDYTNKFDYGENIYGTYFNLNTQFSGINTSIGLRVEYMDRILNQRSSKVNYKYDKLNFFPGISLSKSFENQSNLKLSLTNRINRPDEYMMNPFPEFEDDYFYSEGNPNLVPELIRSLEFSFQKINEKSVLSASTYFRRTSDKIEQKLTLGRQDKIFTIFHNDARDESLGLELMGNFDLAKWISLNANTNLFHYKIEGHIDEQSFSEKDFSWTAQMVGSIQLPKSTSLQLIGYYASETTRSQGKLSDYYFVDLALKKSFFKDKLSINLQLKDVFQTLNYQLITNTEKVNLRGEFFNESPVFMFSLSYQLSNYKKLTKDVVTDFDM